MNILAFFLYRAKSHIILILVSCSIFQVVPCLDSVDVARVIHKLLPDLLGRNTIDTVGYAIYSQFINRKRICKTGITVRVENSGLCPDNQLNNCSSCTKNFFFIQEIN